MKNAVFGFTTPNLGDDLQALAAALFLPSVDIYVDRDRLNKVDLAESHRLIMNSWFAIKRYDAVPGKCIDPVFFGFCVGRDEILNPTWLPYLKQHEPIGCRDEVSVEKLTQHGIKAHMTGCITTWMGRRLQPVPQDKRNGIVFVDVPESILGSAIPEHVRKDALFLTNDVPKAILHDQNARFQRIAAICDTLRAAQLVVTKRLHVMLPCVGFGTPVITFVENKPRNRRRFSGYDRFTPIVYHDGESSPDCADWNNFQPAKIPDELDAHFASLLSKLDAANLPSFASMKDAVATMFPKHLVRYPASLLERARLHLT